MKILLTRTAASNMRSAYKLKQMGLECVSLPLGEVQDTGAEIVTSDRHGYIVTSSNAAKIIAARENPIKGPFYVVGERTKTVLIEHGLTDVRYVARNARALGDILATEYALRKFVYLAGSERAFDFDAYFENFELSVSTVEVYNIVRIDPGLEAMTKALNETKNGVQMHYSALSAASFFKLIEKYDLQELSKTMDAVAISKKTAVTVDFLLVKNIQHAKIETEEEMFKTLKTVLNS